MAMTLAAVLTAMADYCQHGAGEIDRPRWALTLRETATQLEQAWTLIAESKTQIEELTVDYEAASQQRDGLIASLEQTRKLLAEADARAKAEIVASLAHVAHACADIATAIAALRETEEP